MASMSKSLIIAGFHRSGTSLTAQLLGRSGVFLGDDLLGADFSNVYGHFEDRKILRLHDEVLADNGLTWQIDGPTLPEVWEPRRQQMQQIIGKREAEHRVWGFKDPRVCLFLDTWKSLLPGAKILIVYRSPVETTSSLHKRAATGLLRRRGNQKFHSRFWEVPDLALKMWLAYNNMLIEFVSSHPEDVLVFSFDMLRKELPMISLLNQHWDLGLTEMETYEVFDPSVTAEKNDKLPVADMKLIDEALGTWNDLERLSRETAELLGITIAGGRSLSREDFRSAEDVYDVLIENEFQNFRVDFLRGRVQDLEQSQKELRAELARSQAELERAQELAVPVLRQRELESAERDLKLMVGRMSQSSLAPILRLKAEFKELESKYLD